LVNHGDYVTRAGRDRMPLNVFLRGVSGRRDDAAGPLCENLRDPERDIAGRPLSWAESDG